LVCFYALLAIIFYQAILFFWDIFFPCGEPRHFREMNYHHLPPPPKRSNLEIDNHPHTIIGSNNEIKVGMPYPVCIEGDNITVEFKYGVIFLTNTKKNER